LNYTYRVNAFDSEDETDKYLSLR